MDRQDIHPQLLEDCHRLGRMPRSDLLLNRNASLPWFILVPRTALQDVLDLAPELLAEVMGESAAISTFIKRELGYEKVNFAGLGNVVPQMHLHIIGRRVGDPCWPQPVWGNLGDGEAYTPAQLRDWQAALQESAGLVAESADSP
jgi:diadenosine tetraphosphate (Ap4A) HIT family hydrolase